MLNETKLYTGVDNVFKKRSEARRCVLVVEGGSMMEEGVENLLLHEPDLQVIGAPFEGETAFLEDVAALRPDVILMNESGPLTSERILELLKTLPMLASLRVIMFRPEDDTLHVYEHRRVDDAAINDLLNLIRRDED
jgi:chemotaxis response regulator CheB